MRAVSHNTVYRWLRVVLGVGLVGVLLMALGRGWEGARSIVLQRPWVVLAATVLVATGLLGAARAWATLAGGGGRVRGVAAAFLAAQPAKYLPGGFAVQAATQVGLSLNSLPAVGKMSTAYLSFATVQFVAGAVTGSLVALTGSAVQPAIRGLAALGLLTSGLLYRGWISRLMRLGTWVTRREARDDLIPSQAALGKAFAWTLLPIVLSGAAFALVINGSLRGILQVVPAFGAAWALGFVAVPVPSGLGVREAALVVLLPGYPPSVVIAASVVHRLVTLAAEFLLVAVVWRRAFAVPSE